MISPQMRRCALRMAAHNAVGEAFEEWSNLEYQRFNKDFGEPHELEAVLDALDPDERKEFNKVYESVPSALTLTLVRGVLERMGEYFYDVDARDRQYLAESRGHLLNAWFLIERGNFQDSHTQASVAHQRLHWLLYERKRGHERAHHTLVPSTAAWNKLIRILRDIDEVVDRLAVPASVPLGGVA